MTSRDSSPNRGGDRGERRRDSLEPKPRPMKFILVFLGIALIAALSALLGFLTMDFRFQAPDQETDPPTPADSSRLPESAPGILFTGEDCPTAGPRV